MPLKKIKGIKPFNEMLLKSCYYHQLATAYTAFGIDPKVIAGNYLPLYEFDNEQNFLKINCVEILNENLLEKLTGIRKDKYAKIDDIEKFVVEQINAGKPVLMLVDCFYLDYRADTYLQIHMSHSILIYGYDSERRAFILNEHMFRNSYKYIEQFVPMEVVITSYNNFVERLMKNDWSLMVFQKRQKVENIKLDVLKSKLFSLKEDLRKSIRDFGKWIDLIHSNLSEREGFERIKDLFISFTGEVRNSKNLQRNLLGYLYNKGELYDVADRIVENYIFIYGLMCKMKVMAQYNSQFVGKILERCDELFELEKKLHSGLIRGDYA